MIVISTDNNRIIYFNRSGAMPQNYVYLGYQDVNCAHPHGLVYGNDTFFYASSWQKNSVCTYSNAGNITQWTENRLFNASLVANSSTGYHLSIDTSGRYWFSLGSYGTKIFDKQGILRGTFQPANSFMFDTLVMKNYVIYVSEYTLGRILRIQPNLQC